MSSEIEFPYPFSEKAENALHSLRLEGITLSPETLADLYLLDQGKISRKEALENVLKRVTSKETT